jgi:argininosuccinate lyase
MSRRDPSRPLWGGRFSKAPAPEAHALGRSVQFDVRLAAHDVAASTAHVRSLASAGLLAGDEADRLAAALAAIGAEIADGAFEFRDEDEDVHSAIERALTQRLGDLGAKLHAGRSRNDLVVTDLRLWLLTVVRKVDGLTAMLIRSLIDRSREHAASVMPGTTHARPAQPVTLGHHLLAHAWGLTRDLERLEQWSTRSSTSAMGAGALATSTLGLDPSATASALGFRRAFANSIDAVSDRDFVLELLADAAILAMHLSRLAADLSRWTDSIAWAELDEGYTTGSSMMPQKRNPDTAELVRAKAARITGDFGALAAVLQGLPLGYHRDLQEDKEPAFDAVETLELVLPALVGAMETVQFHPEAMRRAAEDPDLFATDVAEALVKGGLPFREAHARTGELLKRVEGEKRTLRDLTAEEWREFGLEDGAELLDPDRAVEARSMPGGPSPESVARQAEALERVLAARRPDPERATTT